MRIGSRKQKDRESSVTVGVVHSPFNWKLCHDARHRGGGFRSCYSFVRLHPQKLKPLLKKAVAALVYYYCYSLPRRCPSPHQRMNGGLDNPLLDVPGGMSASITHTDAVEGDCCCTLGISRSFFLPWGVLFSLSKQLCNVSEGSVLKSEKKREKNQTLMMSSGLFIYLGLAFASLRGSAKRRWWSSYSRI